MPQENHFYTLDESDARKNAFKALIKEVLENAEDYPESVPHIEERIVQVLGGSSTAKHSAWLFCQSIGKAAGCLKALESELEKVTA